MWYLGFRIYDRPDFIIFPDKKSLAISWIKNEIKPFETLYEVKLPNTAWGLIIPEEVSVHVGNSYTVYKPDTILLACNTVHITTPLPAEVCYPANNRLLVIEISREVDDGDWKITGIGEYGIARSDLIGIDRLQGIRTPEDLGKLAIEIATECELTRPIRIQKDDNVLGL